MIEDEFNIEKVEEKTNEIVSLNKQSDTDVANDYDTTRDTLLHALNAGSEALEEILEVAKDTDSPRAYEVFATVMKNLADTSDKLLDLHKKINTLKESENKLNPASVQQTNYYFNGTTSDLQRILADAEENIIDIKPEK